MENDSIITFDDKRSNGMATASLILGILAIVTCCCIFTGIILGALAVIFALLSRGGEKQMSSTALVGLILGIIGILLGSLFFVAIFFYGILEGTGYFNTIYDFDNYTF